MGVEAEGDLVGCRLDDAVLGVARPIRAHRACDGPTGPRAPAPLFAARFIHAIREVLKMHAGITDKNVGRHLLQEPAHRSVGQRPVAQLRFVAAQVGTERAVEAKNRARGEPALPEILAVGEGGEIENSVAFSAVRRKRAGIHVRRRGRQVRARGQAIQH